MARRKPSALWLAALISASVPAAANGQAAADDLFLASLEELMDVRVTSVARKSQRVEDAPAAIYVITRSDIRESGLTLLPEILRLAPGVQVAQLGANLWAVSIRGFNDPFANKLLVLVDGRSVYTRGFSGVFWHVEDMMVSDIERIEVVRGPGGAVWGANAVNGVINIITRPASDTQGFVGELSGGTFERDRLGVRYGGTAGRTAYRAFAQLSGKSNTLQDPSRSSDHGRSLTSGLRLDWVRGVDALMVQADFRRSRVRPGWVELSSFDPEAPVSTDGVTRGESVNVLGRWTRTSSSGRVLQVQAFHSTVNLRESIIQTFDRTSDIDAQYEAQVGDRHAVVFGGGYRHVDYATDDTFTMHLGSARLGTVNLFFQDEVALRTDLALTLGTKLEHDTFAGWGQMPSARVLWRMSSQQRVWAAVSRVRRTPSIENRDFRLNTTVVPGPGVPIVIALFGNPEFRAEQFVQAEVGYRLRLGASASIESTVFSGSYSDLKSTEPGEPTFEPAPAPAHLVVGLTYANLMHARASGVEVNGQWRPVPRWQLDASYTGFHLTSGVDPLSLDTVSGQTDGSTPAHQWQIRSTVSVTPKLQVGGWFSRVGRLRELSVPGYTRLDARAELKLNPRLTAAVVAQNLASRHHAEFFAFGTTASVPRSARVELRWAF